LKKDRPPSSEAPIQYAILFALMSDAPTKPSGTSGPSANSTRKGWPSGKSLRDDDGRLVRGRRSRERILTAARELFLERGFDASTLRAIAERAGMGASSIYRHIQSKEELLIEDLAERQEEAWRRFREGDQRARSTLSRIHDFLDVHHELLLEERDLTVIALRATTRPEARVARRVLVLNDRTIGLLVEVLQMGRMRNKDLDRNVDLLEAARALFHITQGARIPWANGLVDEAACRESIRTGVDLLFRGIRGAPAAPRARAAAAPGP
jgi:AcrR family transcriptional regulator